MDNVNDAAEMVNANVNLDTVAADDLRVNIMLAADQYRVSPEDVARALFVDWATLLHS